MTKVSSVGMTAIDGVEVDISVRGEEDRAEKVLMDLKERVGRLGAAYETETPPNELKDEHAEYVPMMTVAWTKVFEDGDSA